MGERNFKSLVMLGKIGTLLPTLIAVNFFFGWIFFGFYYWILIGITLIFLLMFTFIIFGKGLYAGFFKGSGPSPSDAIDVEGKALDDEDSEVPEWHAPVSCPRCYSKDTQFIEPHYEMSVYECSKCGTRFETEE